MPLFTYKAIDTRGKSVLGRVEAVNLFDLEQRLARMELDLVTGGPSSQRTRFLGGRGARHDLINFHFHLQQLGTHPQPVIEVLSDLLAILEKLTLRDVVAGPLEATHGRLKLVPA